MKTMTYIETPLPYDYSALEPYLDSDTLRLHHDMHQKAYLDKLNTALEYATDFEAPENLKELISNMWSVPEEIRLAVRNNGGGVFNHIFYWNSLSPQKPLIQFDLANALERDFISIDAFKEEFTKQAMNFFGSGWLWLCKDSQGFLKIIATKNQDSPLMRELFIKELTPLLCIDLWEHAYYLKYQNKRLDYINNFWHIANWDNASNLYNNEINKI